MLEIALPNGSLEEQTITFFSKRGIKFVRGNDRRYRAQANDRRISCVVFMRPHIIPYLVGRGSYDLGITGSDMVAEFDDCQSAVIAKLHYSRMPDHEWRLVVVGGQDDPATSLKDIKDDVVILSEYPRITKEALERSSKKAKVHFSHGSTEAHVPDDFPYGVCIALSNTTLLANDLKIIEVISVETAVIVGGPSRLQSREKEAAAMSLLKDLLR